MPILLKIGFTTLLLPKEAQVAKVAALLAGAVELDCSVEPERKPVLLYYPADRQCEIGTVRVAPNQLVSSKPATAPDSEVWAHPPLLKVKSARPQNLLPFKP